MKLVKQIYAGWIGVLDGDTVDNGAIVFTLDNARRRQLVDHVPTEKELQALRKRLRESGSRYANKL
jgi:hypothetical protein